MWSCSTARHWREPPLCEKGSSVFRSRLAVLLHLLLLLPLMGCGPGAPALVRHQVPPALLTCPPAPPPPDPGADDQVLALWIVDLASAGEDCRTRLQAVKGLLDGE